MLDQTCRNLRCGSGRGEHRYGGYRQITSGYWPALLIGVVLLLTSVATTNRGDRARIPGESRKSGAKANDSAIRAIAVGHDCEPVAVSGPARGGCHRSVAVVWDDRCRNVPGLDKKLCAASGPGTQSTAQPLISPGRREFLVSGVDVVVVAAVLAIAGLAWYFFAPRRGQRRGAADPGNDAVDTAPTSYKCAQAFGRDRIRPARNRGLQLAGGLSRLAGDIRVGRWRWKR